MKFNLGWRKELYMKLILHRFWDSAARKFDANYVWWLFNEVAWECTVLLGVICFDLVNVSFWSLVWGVLIFKLFLLNRCKLIGKLEFRVKFGPCCWSLRFRFLSKVYTIVFKLFIINGRLNIIFANFCKFSDNYLRL